MIVDGQDITWEIRRPEVEGNVSPVSAYAGVRKALSAQQRRIGKRGNVVMVGRDIGTVVLPNADLKIYLDASVEERARRRCEELRQRGEPADYDQILAGDAQTRPDRFTAHGCAPAPGRRCPHPVFGWAGCRASARAGKRSGLWKMNRYSVPIA